MRRVPDCIANNEIKGMGPSRKSFGKVYGFQLNSHLPMHLTPPAPPNKELANTVLSNAKQKEMSPVISAGGRGEPGWAPANISKQMFTNRR